MPIRDLKEGPSFKVLYLKIDKLDTALEFKLDQWQTIGMRM